MSFGKFSFSIKKYLEDAGGNENSVPEVPQSLEKKEPPSSKPEKNFSNNLNPGYISLQSAKTQNPPSYQDKGSKGSETYARITPEPSILKYFSASPNNAGPSSMFDIGENHEKDNAKDQKRKYTKKSAKDPAEKPEPKKTQKAGAKGGAKKTKSTIEAENDLHNLDEISFGMREEDQLLGKKPEKLDPVIEPPKIVVAADLSRPVIPSLKDKQKPYEFANLNYWTNNEFPWSKRLLPVMDHFFGYRVFRSNQKAIVNATLSKRDVFVCMPTGGGKSLTFQLPAIIDKGVTIVVMPLLALIYDQVTQMEQKNISVLNLSGGAGAVSAREYNSLLQIYRDHQRTMDSWNYTQEMPYPKMIFITPEKIVQSEITMNFLRSLYQLGLLERIVIDEAHCVSQWGRDFRKDYLNLKKLKEEFPSVCVLALTATATEEIKIDIVEQLKMKNVLYFQNSFNRKNLIFEVRQKGKEAIRDVATFIEEYYPRKCGIIFAATTKEAEQVAQNLRQKHKIKAGFYHGQMSEASRIETQDKWMNDEIHVIVATIAFGMGINKLDVRYVIHFSFSKSISNYYQEAGRAGRDGQKAHCVIFYRYMDKKILEFLNFHNKESSKEMKKENNWELMNIIKYCEDVFSCRRAMLLSYFGERFNKEECAKTCDNCRAGKVALVKDFTEEAKIAVNFVQSREDFDYTMNQLVQVLSGRLRDKNKTKFARETQIGLLKKLKLNEVEVLVKELVIKRFFSEILKKQRGMMSDYLCILKVDKKRAALLLQGKEKVLVAFPTLKRMESNEAKIEKAKPEKAHVEKGDTGVSASQKVATGNQPPQRIYIRQKSDENTVSSIAQKKTIDLASYAFKKPTSPEDFAKDDKKKFVYTKEYGFCTADQFEDIVDRLKIVRKRIFNEVKQNGGGTFQNTNNLDAIIPIEGLYDLCRKLPVSVEDLNTKNIKNIGSKQLQEHGSKFLDEIQHFVKVYQINKNEFIFPKELDEEENREIFDIQDHLAQSNRDMEAVNEWDCGIFDEETRLPSVSKSGNRTDVTDSDRENRGFNPEIEFNVRDFGAMAEAETWRNLEDGEDEEFDERDLDEMAHNERQHGHNQAQGGFEERKFEENLNGENGGSDYDDDELFWIEAALKKDQKNSEDIEPPVRKEEPLSRTSTREYNATMYNPAPSIIDNNNNNNKGGSFFDLQKSETESKPGYISMKAAPVKRDRDSGDRFEATLPKNLKKMKFL